MAEVRLAERSDRRASDLAPDPEMWAALEKGPKLRRILEDFYAQVYADPQLAPFFVHTTIEWAIDHQYSFLHQMFSGEKVFWGYRPRNAHHWMVISDAIFDHREALMEATLRRHGLPEHLIVRWRAMEERFRKQIVKDKPRPIKLAGRELPLEGYESIVMSGGGLCNGCQGEIEVGAPAQYHVRTGEAFCRTCMPETPRSLA